MDDVQIERGSDGARSTIRLIGSVKSEHLREIAHQLEICGPRAALDLEAVTVVASMSSSSCPARPGTSCCQ